MSTTKVIQALRLHGRKDIQLDSISCLPCGSYEVRLRIAYCGICGSDIHEYLSSPIFAPAPGAKHKYTKVELPVCLGHEMSGTVIEVGSDVNNLQLGQQVCVNPSLDDRHYGLEPCSPCSLGRRNLCKRWATYGLNASGGGFSEEIVVKGMNCLVLPPGVSLKVGALAEPLAVAWHCIRISGFKPGQNVLILGAGPIGLAILLLLRIWDANKIIVTEVEKQRILQARKFGADRVFNPLEKSANPQGPSEGNGSIINAIIEYTVDGVDIAFDATGLQSTLDTGLAVVKPGGTFFNVAIHEKPLQLNLNEIAISETKLMGGICYTNEDFAHVLDAMSSGKIPFEQMVTAVVPLSNIIKGGFEELMNNKAKHVKILIEANPA